MGKITVDLGFDKKSKRVTIDGKPHGQPVTLLTQHKAELLPQDDAAKWRDRRFEPREPVTTHRARLMGSGGRKAMLWGIMPRPTVDAAHDAA
jgi:hypothetical protein